MGAGVTLTIGLLAASPKSKVQGPKSAESAEEKHSQGLAEFVPPNISFYCRRG